MRRSRLTPSSAGREVGPISLNDLTLLDASLIRSQLSTIPNRKLVGLLARVINNLDKIVSNHLIDSLPIATRRAVRTESRLIDLPETPCCQIAQRALLDLFFWDLFYRKAPAQYDQFARSQGMQLERLFPSREYRLKRLVDVGCGTGRLIDHLMDAAGSIIGIDPALVLIEYCRTKYARYGNISFFEGSFAKTGLLPGTVDEIVSCFAFSNSETRGGLVGLREMERILRPGGRIRLVVAGAGTETFLRNNGFEVSEATAEIDWSFSSKPSLLLEQVYSRVLNAWGAETIKVYPPNPNTKIDLSETTDNERLSQLLRQQRTLINVWQRTKRNLF